MALSACGGGYGGGKPAAAQAATHASSSGAALHVAATSLGKVLVDGQGMTVYMLSSDKPHKSLCAGQCLQYWPIVPAPSSKATAAGVTGKIASTTSTSGSPMATLAGRPLYTYVQDQAPGDVTGEGLNRFGGVWYAVSPAGQPVKKAAASGAPSAASGGSGYGY
jgi:predicted lipoprotein with Yx(FWY)xxD motif